MSIALRRYLLPTFLLLVTAVPPARAVDVPLSIVPAPLSVVVEEGRFVMAPSMSLSADAELGGAVDAARLLLGGPTGFELPEAESGSLRFRFAASMAPEAYTLRVDAAGIEIETGSAAGAFYALQTLRQLMPSEVYSKVIVAREWSVPFVTIDDAPRFGWRGMHLDVGRHFMPVDFVKKFIDAIAAHKFNSFHWHLTEDQGWRIEIKQYPKLTEIGSMRAQTMRGNILFGGDDIEYDGTPYGGFYTQDEIREVVAYAAERHVNVVPEIEFPGHAQAAIASYPELGNFGEQLKVKEEWGISKHTLKPSEETIQFYRNVLTEVMALFPSTYIHIGGDEAPKGQWEESEYAQQRIRELGLKDENELQSWMIQQMDDFLTANGRKLVGWDEIMQGGLSENATVMSWRGMGPGGKAAAAGHDVVMAPTFWTYFDYYQGDDSREPLAIGFYLPLAKAYEFEPIPADLPMDRHQHILGGQGQLWTEYMQTPEHVEYMAFPRAIALSEVLWRPAEARNYDDFLARLEPHLGRLEAMDINYRPLGDDELSFTGKIKQGFFMLALKLYLFFTE